MATTARAPRSHRAPLTLIALVLALASALAHAVELPATPQDTQLAETFAQAQQMLARANTDGYLDLPAQPTAWPCAIDELQLRKLLGALNSAEEGAKIKRMQRLSDAEVGTGGTDMQTTIRDVRIAPIAAQCKDGRLDGPLEFMLESTRVLDMPS